MNARRKKTQPAERPRARAQARPRTGGAKGAAPDRRSLAAARRREVGDRPKTPEALWEWLRLTLEVEAPRTPLTPGSAAPFDYLRHAFFESEPRDCVVWACRGGGKTFYAAVATVLDLVFKPGIEVCALGGSLEQSERLYAHLRRLFETEGLSGMLEGKPTRRRLRLTSGSVCEISAASETSVRGRRPTRIRCDEVELFDPAIWRAALLAPRSKRCGDVWAHAAVEALSTMHRPHGLMREIVSGAAPVSAQVNEPGESPGVNSPAHPVTSLGARALFRWGVVDVLRVCEPEEVRPCAACELEPECRGKAKRRGEGVVVGGHIEIDDAIAMKRRVGLAQWEAEMLCLRPMRDTLVLPEFDRLVHVFEGEEFNAEIAEGAEGAERSGAVAGTWVCGMDFGFRAPTVVVWAVVDGEGVVRVVDERVEVETRLEAHAEAMVKGTPGSGRRDDAPSRSWPKPSWVGVDPAGHQRSEQTGVSAVSVLRKAGLVVRSRRAGVEEGLQMVRSRLKPATGSPTLFIHARCVKLIEALETYHYPEDPTRAAPVKDGPDHAVDALRYLIVNLDGARGASQRNYL